MIIYNLLYFFFALAWTPRFLTKIRAEENPWELIRQRLGFFPKGLSERFQARRVVWIHAVSVGEVMAVRKFIEELLASTHDTRILLTTVTPTGQKMARQIKDERLQSLYAPFDFTFICRKFFQAVKPQALFLVETELWPGLISEARRAKVPVGILNARLSEKSERRYRFFDFFFDGIFQSLEFVLAQSPFDASRFMRLGVTKDRVYIAGNMKFDNVSVTEPTNPRSLLRKKWGLANGDLLWIAGSTHPGEEEILTEAFLKLRKRFSNLKWILAPRHIERSARLAEKIRSRALRVRLSTEPLNTEEPCEVTLLNQLGVLKDLYRIADVVFVGGSLTARGGQNPIEPAAFKRAMIHGPHVFHFAWVYETLDREGGAILVKDVEDLAFSLQHLLDHESERKKLGENAFAFIQSQRGATETSLQWILHFLSLGYQERELYVEVNSQLLSPAGARGKS